MTVSMLPAISVLGNPTGLQGGIVLEVSREGLDIFVDVIAHIGPTAEGLDGIMGNVQFPVGQAGLSFVSASRDSSSGWDTPGVPISSTGGTVALSAEPANVPPGGQTGRVARMIFRLPSMPTSEEVFTFTWDYIFPLACWAWEDLDPWAGEVLSRSISVGEAPQTPTVTAITGGTGTSGHTGGAGTTTFTVAGTNLAFTNGSAGAAFTATSNEAWLQPGTVTISGATATGATVTVNYNVNAQAAGTAARDATITLFNNVTPAVSGTRVITQAAGPAADVPGIASGGAVYSGGAMANVAADATGNQAITFNITGTHLQAAPGITGTGIITASWTAGAGAWAVTPTMGTVTVNSDTSATAVVNVPVTDNSAGALRTGTLTLYFNGTPIGSVIVGQAGDTPVGSIQVAEVVTTPAPSNIGVPITLPLNPGISDIEFTIVVPAGVEVGSVINNALTWPGATGGWTHNISAGATAGTGGTIRVVMFGITNYTPTPNAALVTLMVNRAPLSATGGPLGDGVYPITLALVDMLNNPTQASQQDGTLVDLTVINGHVRIEEDIVLIGDLNDDGRLTSRDASLIAMYAANGMTNIVGTFVRAAANTGCLEAPSSFINNVWGGAGNLIVLDRATMLAQYLVGMTFDHGGTRGVDTRMCSHDLGTCVIGIRGNGFSTFGCDLVLP